MNEIAWRAIAQKELRVNPCKDVQRNKNSKSFRRIHLLNTGKEKAGTWVMAANAWERFKGTAVHHGKLNALPPTWLQRFLPTPLYRFHLGFSHTISILGFHN